MCMDMMTVMMFVTVMMVTNYDEEDDVDDEKDVHIIMMTTRKHVPTAQLGYCCFANVDITIDMIIPAAAATVVYVMVPLPLMVVQ